MFQYFTLTENKLYTCSSILKNGFSISVLLKMRCTHAHQLLKMVSTFVLKISYTLAYQLLKIACIMIRNTNVWKSSVILTVHLIIWTWTYFRLYIKYLHYKTFNFCILKFKHFALAMNISNTTIKRLNTNTYFCRRPLLKFTCIVIELLDVLIYFCNSDNFSFILGLVFADLV